MAEQQQNPFGLETPPQPGMTQITPQEHGGAAGGSYFSVAPEVLQMMWAPQQPVAPPPQPQIPPPPYA